MLMMLMRLKKLISRKKRNKNHLQKGDLSENLGFSFCFYEEGLNARVHSIS